MGLGGERFTGVVASLPEPVAALDNDFRFIAFNEAYARSFMDATGESPTLGMTLAEALRSIRSTSPRHWISGSRALSGEAFTVLRPSRVPDGNPHTYELGFNPIWGQGRQVVGAVNIVRDVTEQARIQEVQRKMIAELEDRIALRTEEFNGLIHNSPVAFCLFGPRTALPSHQTARSPR
jgi:PAS domain-containing protein